MTAFVNSDLWSTHLALKLLRHAVQNTLVNDESPLKLAVMETTGRYVQDRVLQARIVAIFEENDISASAYSKKKRLDFQRLIELIKRNKIDIILATEVERLVRQPA